MAVMKFRDPRTGQFYALSTLVKGDPGPSWTGPLDDISDVSAPADTPPGRVLGTTATGTWEAVEVTFLGITPEEADARFLQLTGGELTGDLIILGDLLASHGDFHTGADMGGWRVTGVGEPTLADDASTKEYTDSRIWSGTQAQYDAIAVKDPTVLYVIV